MHLSQLSDGDYAIVSSSHILSERGLTKGTKIQMMRQGKSCIIKVGNSIWALRFSELLEIEAIL